MWKAAERNGFLGLTKKGAKLLHTRLDPVYMPHLLQIFSFAKMQATTLQDHFKKRQAFRQKFAFIQEPQTSKKMSSDCEDTRWTRGECAES